jgi:hypothetical protein
MTDQLLTRDEFREGVLTRDGHKCVNCGAIEVKLDVHHIIERKLFVDGGYYLANGATLCEPCHILAENTTLTVETLRAQCGIDIPLLPDHFPEGEITDKWGNPILANGTRLRGELFEEGGVQKVLAPVLYQFTNRVKYGRTFHFPQSPGLQNDDRVHQTVDQWDGMEVVVTLKMDGENTTFYNDYMHARSLEYESHPSRTFIKSIWGRVAHNIPEGFRLCGENVTAVHSIEYTELESYFYVFSIWDGATSLSWDDTLEYSGVLDLVTVPVLYRGMYHSTLVDEIAASLDLEHQEGFVLRPARSFKLREFPRLIGKWVRKSHVSSSSHWMREQVRYNGLKDKP